MSNRPKVSRRKFVHVQLVHPDSRLQVRQHNIDGAAGQVIVEGNDFGRAEALRFQREEAVPAARIQHSLAGQRNAGHDSKNRRLERQKFLEALSPHLRIQLNAMVEVISVESRLQHIVLRIHFERQYITRSWRTLRRARSGKVSLQPYTIIRGAFL